MSNSILTKILRGFTVLATIVLVLAPQMAVSQEEIEFSGTFPEHGGENAPVLIGAIQADSSKWPASLVFVYQLSAFQVGRCTATVIGPRTVLTAAHCMVDGAVAKVKLKNGTNLRVKCTHHPSYADDSSQDFALCLANSDFSGFRYERINIDRTQPGLNDTVTLQGFGCRQETGADHAFGVLYVGTASVKSRGANGQNYIRTVGGAAVCFGDSGGGSFIVKNNDAVLFGVNSRGDISTNSYLSTTAAPAFLSFLDSWVTANNAGPICGRGAAASQCRSGI